MDRTSQPYQPPRRKPVPSNTSPLQQNPRFEPPVGPTPPYMSRPPNTPSNPIRAEQYQGQAYHVDRSSFSNSSGHWAQPQMSSQQPQKISSFLKPIGSFMKGALKATLDPNNLYSNNFGQQQPTFGQQQPTFGQQQPTFGQQQPTFGQQQPIFGQQQPTFGQQQQGPSHPSNLQPSYIHGNGNSTSQDQMSGGTIVNGLVLDAAAIFRLRATGISPMRGRYWYDNRCGAWGLESGPCVGILPPSLSLGGPMAPNASGPSNTGVFINGRQIHSSDVAQFRVIGINCIPGRYWVNADGTYGWEGMMIPLGNLQMQAMASKKGGSGYGSWSNGDSFGGSDGQGFNYVGGHDSTGRMWSVTTDGSGYFSS